MKFENQKPLQPYLAIVGIAVFFVYCMIVFIGEAMLFGAYQFLRNEGWSFWEATMIITSLFGILAIPAIGKKFLK
jgi:hypothetical protein